jgi:putative Holliday junction resolvase
VNENSFHYPGRILALDLGRRRIGLAMSDELRITAQGLDTLARTSLRDDLAALTKLASDRGVSLIVIGNPIRLNGVEGAQSVWVREFASKLEARTGIPVRLWDERFTTVEAERVLRESGIGREKRGRAVDRLAAVILLQSYLGSIDTAPENAEA